VTEAESRDQGGRVGIKRWGRTGAIMIFEEKERTRTDPKNPGEDEFAFYDSIAGAAYDVYRAKLNEWIAEYPDDECAEAS